MRWRQRPEKDFDREVRAHLDLETDRLVGEGMSQDEARVAARLRFGNVVAHKEHFFESRRVLWLHQARQDVQYALRSLRLAPGFSITVILTLALGIGANTALFSGVKGLMLDTLSIAEPGRLVRLRVAGENDMSRSRWEHVFDAAARGAVAVAGHQHRHDLVAEHPLAPPMGVGAEHTDLLQAGGPRQPRPLVA
jgi:hypothetical protein